MTDNGVVDATRIIEQLVLEKHAVVSDADERIGIMRGALFALCAEIDPEAKGRIRLTKAQIAAGASIVSVAVEPDRGGAVLLIERAEGEA